MAWTKNFTLPTNFNNNNQFDTSSVLTPDMFNVPYQNTLYLKDHLDIVEGNLSNIDNSLYNLGAYDTITANADGSYTITRQTGYLVLDGVENKFEGKFGNPNNGEYYYNGCKDYISKPSNVGTIADIISNTLKTVSGDNLYFQNIYGIVVDTDGLIIIGLTTSISTIEDANAWLIQNPTSIQYKLATSYTEKVEANHYARYNQDFILEHNKSEAERSANLLNIADVGSTTTNGITYSIKDGVVTINGTATNHTTIDIGSISSDIKLNDIFTIKTFNSNVYFQISFWNGDTWLLTTNKFQDNATIQVSNANANKLKLHIFVSLGETINNSICKPMIVRGSTSPITYQPYNQNKHITNNEAEFLKTEYDRSANLTPYNLTSFPLNSSQKHLIAENLPSGTYTLSLNLNAYTGGSAYIVYINDNSVGTYNNGTSATFTSNEYINSIKIYSNDAGATSAKVMLNEGSIALPYQEYEGKIVHLKDLELYGTKPAIANVQCPIDLSEWNDDTGSYSSGSSVLYLHFENDYLGNIYLLPTSSSGSMTKGIVRYTGGDTDAFTWSIGFITNTYIKLRCTAKFYLYAPASSSGTLKTANYVLEIEDMYGHTFSLPFSVNYRIK